METGGQKNHTRTMFKVLFIALRHSWHCHPEEELFSIDQNLGRIEEDFFPPEFKPLPKFLSSFFFIQIKSLKFYKYLSFSIFVTFFFMELLIIEKWKFKYRLFQLPLWESLIELNFTSLILFYILSRFKCLAVLKEINIYIFQNVKVLFSVKHYFEKKIIEILKNKILWSYEII